MELRVALSNTQREVVLADASVPFRARYGLHHFFRCPKTRRPVPHSVSQDRRRETLDTHRTVFYELSITRSEKPFSQIIVLCELRVKYHIHHFDIYFEPVRSLLSTVKSCFGARGTGTGLRPYLFS